ncbi:MAG: UPF0158 family protein [Myxococcota bacterium]
MSNEDHPGGGKRRGEQNWRDVPIDWEALEDAFENNAPEVHSYLHVPTGDVLRIVDGVADPQMHARIAADQSYLRIEPVSSREQYRWMERFIPMVDDPTLQQRLTRAIDGKGAFRRFKDVLMSYGAERERWFAFRSERLRIFMEAWLNAHALRPVKRPVWVPDLVDERPSQRGARGSRPGGGAGAETPSSPGGRTPRSAEALRRQLRDLVDALGPRELDTLAAFAEFLQSRKLAMAAVPRSAPGSAPASSGRASSSGMATASGMVGPDDEEEEGTTDRDEPSSARVVTKIRAAAKDG